MVCNSGLLNDDILIKTKWYCVNGGLWLNQSDTCVNGGLLNDDILVSMWLLNDDILIKTYLVIPVSMVVYWMMILWLKKEYLECWLKQSDTNVSMVVYWMMIFWFKYLCQSLLNDDILIKTKWYLEIKTKWYLCQWWFIEWWYFD